MKDKWVRVSLLEFLACAVILTVVATVVRPAFAQADGSQVRASVFQNLRQIGVSSLNYASDNDDRFVPVNTWRAANAPARIANAPFTPWSWLLRVYGLTAQQTQDPSAPAALRFPPAWNSETALFLQPQIGYNYTALSPLVPAIRPVTYTEIAHPALTIAFAAKNSKAEVRGLSGPTGFYWFGPGTLDLQLAIEAPECGGAEDFYCMKLWGATNSGAEMLGSNEAGGAYTGSVSLREGRANIVTVDGSVWSLFWPQLVAGTNFPLNSNGWPNGNSGWRVTDETAYLWDAR